MLYSILIIPPQPLFTQLKKIIDELAKEFKGPVFEPHMTLVGNIEMELPQLERKVKELALGVDKLQIKLGQVSFSTTYFQCVFIRVQSNSKLMQLNLDGKKLFGMKKDVFMPHISVLYGDQDMIVRESVASGVKLLDISFEAKEFVIVPASGDLSKWVPASIVPFNLKS